jgi:hypothetical protein
VGGSRDPHGAAVPPAADDVQPPGQLDGVEGVWRGAEGVDAGVEQGLGLRAAGGGPGLVPRPKFETASPVRASWPHVGREEAGLASALSIGGRPAAAELLDRESSHSSVDRSRPGGSLAGISGSSEEGASPVAPKGRAPGPPCGSGRASATTVTRNRYPVPAPPRGVSRAEIARSSVGSESSRFRWRDTCGARYRRSSSA